MNYPDMKVFLKEIWPLLEAENVEDESYNQEICQVLNHELIHGRFKELKNLIKSYMKASCHKKPHFVKNTWQFFEQTLNDAIKMVSQDYKMQVDIFENPTNFMYIIKGLGHASELITFYYPYLTVELYENMIEFANIFGKIFLEYMNVNKFVTFKQMMLMYEIVKIIHAILIEPVY